MECYNGKGGACCSQERFEYYFEFVRNISPREKIEKAKG